MFVRAARISSLLFLIACGGGSSQKPDAAPPPPPPPPPDAAPDAPSFSSNYVAIPLTSVDALTYLAPLNLPGNQPMQVIVDTGSSTLAVASSTCTSCGVSPLYMPGTGAVDQQKTTSSTYGDGTGWSAEVYQDMVQLGTAATVQVDFGAITSSSGFFRSLGNGAGPIPYQGIMGLGPDALLTMGTTSYPSAAFTAGTASQMAFQLCPDAGTMWLGGVDPTAEAAAPAVTPMVSGFPYYSVHISDVAVGGTSLGVAQAGFGPTIVDTGTSISFIPSAALQKLSAAITSSTGYSAVFGTQALSDMTCMTTSMTASQIDAMLPPLEVTFPGAQGMPADVPATKSYLFDAGGGMWCFAFGDASQVFGGFNASLIGDSLLAGYTTTFDVGNHQIGFALQQGCHEASLAVARPAPHYQPGTPWWQQDPRVHTPSPDAIRQRLAAYHVP